MAADRRLRTRLTLIVAMAVAAVAIPAAALAASKTKTKTCGRAGACSASLSSAPPPQTSPGGASPGGGSGGSGTAGGTVGGGGAPTPGPAPAAPFSTFDVRAKARATHRIQSGSKLFEALNMGRRLVCPGYTRRDGGWFEFKLTTKSRTGITYEIKDTIHNTTPDGVRFCAGLGYRFTTFSGRPARRATLPDGTRGYVGLLPVCKEDANGTVLSTGPCVSFIVQARNPDGSLGDDTILGAQIPATTQTDPWGGA